MRHQTLTVFHDVIWASLSLTVRFNREACMLIPGLFLVPSLIIQSFDSLMRTPRSYIKEAQLSHLRAAPMLCYPDESPRS